MLIDCTFLLFQVVGESGLFTPEDISYVQNAGVKAVSPIIGNKSQY